MTTYSWHMWVRKHQVEAYEKVGWLALESLEGTTHGHWSCHLVWPGDGDPVEPPKETS